MSQGFRRKLTIIVLAAAIIVGYLFYSIRSGRKTDLLSENEGGVTFTATTGENISFDWSDAKDVQLYDEWDFGHMVSGTDSRSERSGIWNNEELGEYYLFTVPKAKKYIGVRLLDGSAVVFNCESTSATEKYFAKLPEAVSRHE